jgi:putative DNA primase/helicase
MNTMPSTLIHANSKLEFAFSTVTNRFDKNPKNSKKSWGDFCESFSSPDRSRGKLTFEEYHLLYPTDKQQRSDEKDGPGWISAVFNPSEGRSNENVERVTGLVLDIDTGEIKREFIEETLKAFEFFAHTTYSHKPENPKWRVIIPSKSPFSSSQLEGVFNHFNDLFGGILDTCGKRPSQLYYIPSCPFDGPFESFRHPGMLFDPFTLNPNPSRPSTKTPYPTSHTQKPPRSSRSLPKPCKDGERHGVALSYIGKLIGKEYSYDEVLEKTREWNLTNVDPWPDEILVSKVDGVFSSDQRNNPERHEPKPWEGIEIPYEFNLSLNGVKFIPSDERKSEILISSPSWVSAKTRSIEGKSWGLLVEWIDCDKKHHKQSIPKERFHENGNKLAQDLASQGLDIVPGHERYLLKYLGQFNPKSRITCVPQLGWLENPNGRLIYVLPNQAISSTKNEECVFQPEKHSPSAATIKSKGALEDWQENISYLAQDHPYLIFCLCVSFAGPLLKAAGLEGGGFHLYGRSSHGKTTAAQLAASVWGCGSDPSEAAKLAYVRKWNTTHNGLEALAASHNDGVLILDEAGTCNAKDFGKVIYDVTGGQGKVSLNADRGIRESRSWHILLLSTGEISAQQKIEEEGNTARAGQRLRLMDIPIQDGIFNPNIKNTGSILAQEIKRECSNYYGTSGPAFLEKLIKSYKNFHSLKKMVKGELEKSNKELTIKSLEPEQARALQRLALIKVAGELAVEFDILPFEKEDIKNAIIHIRDVWIKGQDCLSHSLRGINAIRDFIVRHQSRFEDSSNSKSSQIRDLVGYFDKDENLFLFTTEGFKEACKGLNFKEILEDLRGKGLLRINEGHRFTYKKQISGIGRFRFYAIEGSILEYEDDLSKEKSGTVGH